MALTEIEYGSLASSEVMNNNFEYLDNKITAVSESITTNTASINSNIASINSSISSLSDDIDTSIEEINTNIESAINIFSTNGLYVTTYKNGGSWYREFFSDEAKKNRVWLEQGGVISTTNDTNITVTFLKSFSDTNYSIVKNMGFNNTGGVAARWMGFWSLTTSNAITGSTKALTQRWYACGK